MHADVKELRASKKAPTNLSLSLSLSLKLVHFFLHTASYASLPPESKPSVVSLAERARILQSRGWLSSRDIVNIQQHGGLRALHRGRGGIQKCGHVGRAISIYGRCEHPTGRTLNLSRLTLFVISSRAVPTTGL